MIQASLNIHKYYMIFSPSGRCFRKGYSAGVVSEDEDNKSLEKRDNRNNCQQVYTSSPIKQEKKDHQGEKTYSYKPVFVINLTV